MPPAVTLANPGERFPVFNPFQGIVVHVHPGAVSLGEYGPHLSGRDIGENHIDRVLQAVHAAND